MWMSSGVIPFSHEGIIQDLAMTTTEKTTGWNEDKGWNPKKVKVDGPEEKKKGGRGVHSENKETLQIITNYKNARSGSE